MKMKAYENKPVTLQAVYTTFASDTPRGPDEWFPFAELIAELIRSLFSGCAPTPVEAVNWINWRPYFDPFGFRLRRHQDGIRTMVARKWHGPKSQLKCAQEQLIQAINAGRAGKEIIKGLYMENTNYRG